MIEKMMLLNIVAKASEKEELLKGLRDLGTLHISELQAPDRALTDRFSLLTRTEFMLRERMGKDPQKEILEGEEFEKLFSEVIRNSEREETLKEEEIKLNQEKERLSEWGDFSVTEVKELRNRGFDFSFYNISQKEFEKLKDRDIRFIVLSQNKSNVKIALLGKMPSDIQAGEFPLPEKGLSEIEGEILKNHSEQKEVKDFLDNAAYYAGSFTKALLNTQNEAIYSSAGRTLNGDRDFVWIRGYIPEAETESFREMAKIKAWGYSLDDVSDDDPYIPTKIRYNKLTALMKPVFDILGTVPGYREFDISFWFLLFFALFFAMIVGDAGYGVLFLIGAIGARIKIGKFNDSVLLLTVLSVTTVIWGAVTGTWFGMESAMKIPFLKMLVIPSFANYPEYFNVTALQQQNTIMKFSFTIGAVQMAIACILAVRKKVPEKDLSFIADIGWFIAIIALYFLVLGLVIGEEVNMPVIGVFVGIAFLTVVLFGGMSPDKTIPEGIKAGLGGSFTTFLNTISCFGNIMSYIRLFAVGLASLAIAQSFNSMASGFKGGLVVVGFVIVLVGHSMNIIMAMLSVVVHGVRLNLLEFSGQLGMEWAGIAYDPFRKTDKLKK